MSYLISIDPGLKSSGTGITIFDGKNILKKIYCSPKSGKTLKDLVDPVIWEIQAFLSSLKASQVPYEIVVEESFYPGLANKLHQRFLGVLQYNFPTLQFIAPMSVKKLVTGSGKATKEDIKKYLLSYYDVPLGQYDQWENEDVNDSVAIGIAYMRRKVCQKK